MFGLLRGFRYSPEARLIITRFLKNARFFFKKIKKIYRCKKQGKTLGNLAKTADKNWKNGAGMRDDVIGLVMETPIEQATADKCNT